MTADRWRQIEDLYQAAKKCLPGERAALLECTDPEIRSRVERMLELESGGQILDQSAAGLLESATKTVVLPGTQLGPYKIEAQIGAGGMGTVYRAIDSRLQRSVAIKIAAERYSERFQLEAQAISTLNHPHVCTLYDVGPNYLVMEFLEGATLSAEIKRGPLVPELVARYGAQIAEALAEAHALGIVHRDLKPSNIMLTRHGIKVLDFGLAKMLSETGITKTGGVMGTPAYMAPEQVDGREPSAGTDLFALGLVLYEMAVGKLPFPGASLGQMLSSGAHTTIPAPSEQRADLPPVLDGLVTKLLERDLDKRPQSASEIADELTAIADRLSAPPSRFRLRPAFAIPAAVLVVLLAAAGAWLYHRSDQRHWVREQAIPEINRLAPNTPLAAFLVWQKAEKILPGDPQLASIAKSLTRRVAIQSSPPGATVEIQDYRAPNGDWLALGATPLSGVLIPDGYFRWRVSKPGSAQILLAPSTEDHMQFAFAPAGTPAGMVHVPKGTGAEFIDFVGFVYFNLPAHDIDQFEVTNRQYQEFVDQGGYQKRQYWEQKFIKDGKEISWDQAMGLFRDPTGRPGPSTWEGGHFPQAQADYPVSGVSWYEAAAYAEFAGKSLPTVTQWYQAAPTDFADYNIVQSNFSERGPWRVGNSPDVGPFGTYDMSGNVREWSFNTVEKDRRFILGGAWRTQTYQAFDPEALPPFDRSELNGFRCVRNSEPLPASATAPLVGYARDFAKAKPASDEVFQAYQTMYAYDRNPLNAQSEGIVENTADWTKEKLSIDAGYGGERLPLFLFLPKNVRPPFQTVLFFPSARVDLMPSSRNLGDMQFVDYIIQSGRALLYPIYEGTYERVGHRVAPGAHGDLDLTIQESKEVRRSVDYLETRADIDKSKIAYLGVSQGTAYGVIYAALEPRFKTIIFLDGGFFLNETLPPRDQVNFAPRIKQPVLMVNGRYDFTFSVDRSQLPLFRMLGTPEADKRHVVFDTPHDISQNKAGLSKEVLAWLDKYLGRVN
jgi:predicted esterase/predicted Ser/Thr protein kinase